MMWLEALYAAIGVALFFVIFIESDNEPLLVRLLGSASIGVCWGALALLIAFFIVSDWVDDRIGEWLN